MEIRKTLQIELSEKEYEAIILAASDPQEANADLVLKLRRAWQAAYRSDMGSLSVR
jgi:hypothetical protein